MNAVTSLLRRINSGRDNRSIVCEDFQHALVEERMKSEILLAEFSGSWIAQGKKRMRRCLGLGVDTVVDISRG